MTPHLTPYPAYKPSGVTWLGDVPAHWEVVRLKGHVANIADMTNDCCPDEIYLALENVESWTGKLLEVGKGVRFDSQVKRFRVGDVLFSKLRPNLAKVTSPNLRGVCVGEFLVLRRLGETLLPGYSERVMRSKPVIDAINASTFGAKMPRADWQFIGSMKYPLPPINEQRTIARYLDHVDRRIQRYIEAKEQLIALLQEARQSIIQRAVTRGLDPDVPLKPSGVEWLGDVPAHWEVRRLKTLCSMKSGEAISNLSIEPKGGYPVYGGNGLRGYTSDYTHDGAFALIGRQGALCGNVHIARGKFWATEHAVVASYDTGHNVVWFSAMLTAMNLNQYSLAAAQPGLAVERILNLHVPVPPKQEQCRIANLIESANSDIAAVITTSNRQSERMAEYRASLIAHVVTGKLDVRAAAAQLPKDSPAETPLPQQEKMA